MIKRSVFLTSIMVLSVSHTFAAQSVRLESPHLSPIRPAQRLVSGFFIVPQGAEALVEVNGKYTHTAEPGLHIGAPLITKYRIVSTQSILVDLPAIKATTSNTQVFGIDVNFNYRITNSFSAVYHIQNLEQNLIFSLNQSVLACVGERTSQDMITLDKDGLSKDILLKLNGSIKGRMENQDIEMDNYSSKMTEKSKLLDSRPYQNKDWGAVVDNVSITQIVYPQEILKAMEAQNKAELDRRTNELQAMTIQQRLTIEANTKAQTDKISVDTDLKNAENQAKTKQLNARAEAEALIAESNGKAEAARIEAQGRADALLIEARAKVEKEKMFIKLMTENAAYADYRTRELASEALGNLYRSDNAKVIMTTPTQANDLMTNFLAMSAAVK